MIRYVITFAFLLSALFRSYEAYGKIWFVDINASGANSGASWSNAYTDLQSAISSSFAGDTVWVASGTYKPTSGTSRSASFNLKSGISIYGGFAGTETKLNQRDFNSNTTILSGDIGTINTSSDNSYHVVYAINISITARIDGFRIVDGLNGYGAEGAGMFVKSSKVVVANCLFAYNSGGYAGGLYQEGGQVVIENTTFSYNACTSHVGAAIYSKNTGELTLTGCSFIANQVGSSAAAGILYISGITNVYVSHCIFAGNSSKNGIITVANGSSFTVINSLIVGNYSGEGKFVIAGNTSNTVNQVINCTIAHNRADSGSLTNKPVVSMSSLAKVKNVVNSIIYNNTGSADVSASCNVSNCVLQRGYATGTNRTTTNPGFIKPGAVKDAPFVLSGLDYSLDMHSVAIDAGSTSYLGNSDSLDLAGNQRTVGANPDAGAFERQYCELPINLDLVGKRNFCIGDSVVLVADTGNWWLWNNQSEGKSLTAHATGMFSVVVMDTVTGCRGSAKDSVTGHTFSVSLSGTDRFCFGDSSVLTANGNNTSFLWNTSDTTQIIVVNATGRYKVAATSNAGCVSYDSMDVIADSIPIPGMDITESSGIKDNDTSICKGDDITLNATGGSAYVWSDSTKSSGLTISPDTDIMLAVKVINSFGCAAWSAPVFIKVNPLPSPVIKRTENSGLKLNDGVICKGDTVYLETTGFSAYSWSNGSKTSSIAIAPANNITYSVQVTDSLGCSNSASGNIVVNALPQPTIQRVDNMLQTGSFASYQWYLNDTLMPGKIFNTLNPVRNGKYKVVVRNIHGCEGVSTVYNLTDLSVVESAVQNHLEIYPNPSDGVFRIETQLKIESIRAFDIFGKEIRSSEIKWFPDGTGYTVNINQPQSMIFIQAQSQDKVITVPLHLMGM